MRHELEVVPYEHEGKSIFLLADSESEDDRAVGLSPVAVAAASLFDGRRTAREVAAGFERETGQAISEDDVLTIARKLEEQGLLETAEADAARRARLDAFRKSAVRASRFLPKDLTPYIQPVAAKASKGRASGFFAPHIDLMRGKDAYQTSYAALADSPPPDVIVALGVAHASPNSPWTFTRKAYETPKGAMKVDEDLYAALTKPLWYDPLADEGVHRREHSLEFQAVWLRHLWGDKTPPWVPILCSTFERYADEKSPSTIPTVEQALVELGRVLAERVKGGRVLILGGVDLAHVGRRFGDDLDVTQDVERRIEAEDRASLEKALALDAEGFYASVVKDDHWRKVCGLAALYTQLRWLKAAGAPSGELLAYGQAPDPAGGVVSFAGAIYR